MADRRTEFYFGENVTSPSQSVFLFDPCAGKHGGNEESREANLKVHDSKAGARDRVYARLILSGPKGYTCKEIAMIEGRAMHQISGRLTELKAQLKAFATERTRDGGRVILADTFWRGIKP